MPFNSDKCVIPTVWCGKGNKPFRKGDNVYTRTGTRTECMKKGFGAGMFTEKNKNIPKTSLRNIKYVGEEYESRFKNKGIKTLKQLISRMRSMSPKQIEKFLKNIFSKNTGFDGRSYNSTLLFLYRHGNGDLPQCKNLV